LKTNKTSDNAQVFVGPKVIGEKLAGLTRLELATSCVTVVLRHLMRNEFADFILF